MRVREFGRLPDGRRVEIYTLSSRGIEVEISILGGAFLSIFVPDRDGDAANVILSYGSLAEYLDDRQYVGGVVGRYANRIAGGRFSLDGVGYQLTQNDGENHLHGGVVGLRKALWSVNNASEHSLELEYLSREGEEGYPGNMRVQLHYTVAPGELQMRTTATTDQATILNITAHPYFNLAGAGDILGHQLEISADQFLPVNDSLIPTGEFLDVAGTRFDFRSLTDVGSRIGDGYDHNFVLRSNAVPACRLYDPGSGRTMEILTTEPGVQFYSGQYLRSPFHKHSALCLETQHFPDSPNHPEFPSAGLNPGQQYSSTTIFRFKH